MYKLFFINCIIKGTNDATQFNINLKNTKGYSPQVKRPD